MSLARMRVSHVLDILWRKWKSLKERYPVTAHAPNFEAYKYLRPPLENFKERWRRARSSPLSLFYHTVMGAFDLSYLEKEFAKEISTLILDPKTLYTFTSSRSRDIALQSLRKQVITWVYSIYFLFQNTVSQMGRLLLSIQDAVCR